MAAEPGTRCILFTLCRWRRYRRAHQPAASFPQQFLRDVNTKLASRKRDRESRIADLPSCTHLSALRTQAEGFSKDATQGMCNTRNNARHVFLRLPLTFMYPSAPLSFHERPLCAVFSLSLSLFLFPSLSHPSHRFFFLSLCSFFSSLPPKSIRLHTARETALILRREMRGPRTPSHGKIQAQVALLQAASWIYQRRKSANDTVNV